MDMPMLFIFIKISDILLLQRPMETETRSLYMKNTIFIVSVSILSS